jgi:hypothetical protein
MERHHQYTGLLLLLFMVAILLSAIFFTVAQTKLREIAEYKAGNSKLKSANNNLMVAYILGYIAAGIGLVLAILYFGHVSWGIKNEIPHLILFIILFGLVIVSGIFGFIALSEIDEVNPSNKNGSTGWIWGALVAALVALILIIISGAWRAQYKSSTTVTHVHSTATTKTVTLNSAAPPGYPAPALVATTPYVPATTELHYV